MHQTSLDVQMKELSRRSHIRVPDAKGVTSDSSGRFNPDGGGKARIILVFTSL